ncbi:hypothetical protein [Botryobacter ruber]|uniref:hypothetical protein n=1 Tax=Botryobacter ruber TaxID=2171629 RepID=UPI000E0BD874|nr:hypothetical protein [Botryobacter ruber]
MYIIRDIFYLKFGHFKDAKALLTEAKQSGILPQAKAFRFLSDFTGDAYRFIMEEGYDSLADYEKALGEELATDEWQKWYAKFKEHVERSHREILKEIM